MRPIAPVARIMNVEIEGWHIKVVLGSQLSGMEVRLSWKPRCWWCQWHARSVMMVQHAVDINGSLPCHSQLKLCDLEAGGLHLVRRTIGCRAS